MDHNPWLDSLFASIDGMDAERFAAHLAPDALFQFGNAPAVRGTAEIVAAVGGLGCLKEGVEHTHKGTYPGRIVIYPQIDMPLTPVSQLSPTGAWTVEAEARLLESKL